ncbi:MAG: nucleoside-diphosphate-sugar epimerase [Vicingaceae bacterium]|jgi:nucleoside-diphosphate-sugar epimerase
MKVLLTGCAGFIGSHTCEKLLSKGFSVIGIDNFSTFYDRGIKEKNLDAFRNHPNFIFKEIDIRNFSSLKDNLKEEVDIVVHLAAKAGVRPSILNPSDYIDVNIKGTQNLLQWMLDRNCKKLFFASSSSVYGNNKNRQAVKEGDFDLQPISPYAFTKRSGELMNYTYHHLYDFDIINARFFTVYGPRQRPDLAIHKFVDLISRDQPIHMFGDGSSARDYTFIEDTVNGIVSGVDYLLENENVIETINLGNQTPVPLITLIKTIYAQLVKDENIIQEGMQEGDVNLTYANIEKAQKLLGYNPTVKLEDGIARFVEWYRQKDNH